MRFLIGIAIIVVGVLLGIYVGVWLCFVGGIIDILTEVRAENLDEAVFAIGVAKIMFGQFFGYLVAGAICFMGVMVMGD